MGKRTTYRQRAGKDAQTGRKNARETVRTSMGK